MSLSLKITDLCYCAICKWCLNIVDRVCCVSFSRAVNYKMLFLLGCVDFEVFIFEKNKNYR